MYIDFDNMPDTSRLWIYMANRRLTDDEKEKTEKRLQAFIDTWQVHNEDLKASFLIKYKQFIIILVDENYREISGCAIDKSVHLLQALEKELDIEFLNKLIVSFWEDDRIKTVGIKEFIDLCQKEIVHKDTIIFDNTIKTKAELAKYWQWYAIGCWTHKLLKFKHPPKIDFYSPKSSDN